MNGRLFQIIRNMGWRYTLFHIGYALQRYSGWLILQFPRHQTERKYTSLDNWRKSPLRYFFCNDPGQLLGKYVFEKLKSNVEQIKSGQLSYFSSEWIPFTDWHTNPQTGYRYSDSIHWSKIRTMDPAAGDIKYVWEISRFTFLYDLIRYDFHFGTDQSEFVFDRIENWIDCNPVNCGPNWICGQEMSLRVINWTFALQYCKHSAQLTPPRFDKIINSIHRQMQHVAGNSSFSGIAVRNNHILTESLGLYLTGLLYPFFPESAQWKQIGKRRFEEEITYQIDDNGAFIQFSFNYHRVVVQLLSQAIRLSTLNGERFAGEVYRKAKASVLFLQAFQDQSTGWLPNYGNNDGALFFPLTACHFRDYRPQLQALAVLLGMDTGYGTGEWNEESFWMGYTARPERKPVLVQNGTPVSMSGYHVLRDNETITFIRCGMYQQRPFQCDHLHLDIWVNGDNILRDAGTFSYNTNENVNGFFAGTRAHNTVMPGDEDQMLKGPGFIWYNWIIKTEGVWKKEGDDFEFEGWFEGFRELGKDIRHTRKVTKQAGQARWHVQDMLINAPDGLVMNQIWNPAPGFLEKFTIIAIDADGIGIAPEMTRGWYAEIYGEKEETTQIVFRTKGRLITTTIEAKSST